MTSSSEVHQSSSEIPKFLGRYKVIRLLGYGGVAEVYEGYDSVLDRRVALKRILKHVHDDLSKDLMAEARMLAKISNPNVVRLYHTGDDPERGGNFLAIELIDGQKMNEWMKDGSCSLSEVLDYFSSAGKGLMAVHEAGLVHRDFKPKNVLLGKNKQSILIDFGLTCRKGEKPNEPKGVVVGTLPYMAPEMLRGMVADPLSDQFSFCAVLYEVLFDQMPFGKPDPERAKEHYKRVTGKKFLPIPRGVQVPDRLIAALKKGLSANPKKRWSGMQALLAELEAIKAEATTEIPALPADSQSPRRGNVALALAIAGTLGTAAVCYMSTGDTCVDKASDEMEEVWSAAKRARVDQALSDQSLTNTKEQQLILELFDAYRSRLFNGYKQACEEKNTRLFDCLNKKKGAFGTSVQGVLQAEKNEKSLDELNIALPDLDACYLIH